MRLYSHVHSMRRHLRLECGVPPQFKCSYCDFQSTRKGSINAHIAVKHIDFVKTTTSVSKHICKQCHKSFPYKLPFIRHMQGCHSSSFSCPQCPFIAHKAFELDKHIGSTHFTS